MSCIQLTTVQPTSCTYRIGNQLRHDSSAPCILSLQRPQMRKVSMNLAASSSSYLGLQILVKSWKFTPITSGYKQSTPTCIFGEEGKSKNDAEGSPWKSLEKAMSNLRKESSVEDLLRQQIQEQEFYDEGSGEENTGGGGGGGGGGGSSPGESDDMSFLESLDELFQMILGFTGVVLLYRCFLDGEDIIAIGRDIVKFLLFRSESIRFKKFRAIWELKLENLKWTWKRILENLKRIWKRKLENLKRRWKRKLANLKRRGKRKRKNLKKPTKVRPSPHPNWLGYAIRRTPTPYGRLSRLRRVRRLRKYKHT